MFPLSKLGCFPGCADWTAEFRLCEASMHLDDIPVRYFVGSVVLSTWAANGFGRVFY
jgi:hypothetical protein